MKNSDKVEFINQLQKDIELDYKNASLIGDLYQKEIIKKGDFLIKKDSYARKIVFINNGYIRCYTQSRKKEVTHWVYWKNRWVTDFPSFKKYRSSPWNFQATTDCDVYSLTYSDYIKIKDVLPSWDSFENKLMFKLFMALEHRLFTFISMNAKERYSYLHDAHPEIFNQIPLNYLASLLKMTPETLSRIRRSSISETF